MSDHDHRIVRFNHLVCRIYSGTIRVCVASPQTSRQVAALDLTTAGNGNGNANMRVMVYVIGFWSVLFVFAYWPY